nr:MFS transporter [Actinomycetota bacterium]
MAQDDRASCPRPRNHPRAFGDRLQRARLGHRQAEPGAPGPGPSCFRYNPRFTAASIAITLIFFALFGAIFVLTQHLQFVLGYSALEAGFRVTPIATLVIAAPIAARVVERVGTKAVVTAGLTVVAIALLLISGVDIDSGYGTVGWALALMGLGMGATMAPATDSIMGSLPLAKAGVGSAMNDTTRMVGGALGSP